MRKWRGNILLSSLRGDCKRQTGSLAYVRRMLKQPHDVSDRVSPPPMHGVWGFCVLNVSPVCCGWIMDHPPHTCDYQSLRLGRKSCGLYRRQISAHFLTFRPLQLSPSPPNPSLIFSQTSWKLTFWHIRHSDHGIICLNCSVLVLPTYHRFLPISMLCIWQHLLEESRASWVRVSPRAGFFSFFHVGLGWSFFYISVI